MTRGQNLNIAAGATNKRIMLGSELAKPEQRGDDALDREFVENGQERAEMAPALPYLRPEKSLEAGLRSESRLDSEAAWLAPNAIERERTLKLVGWFLTSPTGHVRRRTGLHPMTIARMRESLRSDCPDLVAKAVAMETAHLIAEALRQRQASKKLRESVLP
jgi:hypothetical protein